MLFNSSSFNVTPFNGSESTPGYGSKPAMPAGVALSGEVYILILTGGNDATTDVTLPITGINLRWTLGGLAWVNGVVPDGLTFAPDIAARPNGELVFLRGERWTNGWVVISETLRAPVSLSRLDEGTLSNSYSLQGYSDMLSPAAAVVSSGNPDFKFWGGLPKDRAAQTIAVTGVTFRRGAAGGQEIRAGINTNIRPGDTVTFPAGSFVVRSIQWFIGDTLREMMLTE